MKLLIKNLAQVLQWITTGQYYTYYRSIDGHCTDILQDQLEEEEEKVSEKVAREKRRTNKGVSLNYIPVVGVLTVKCACVKPRALY